MTAVLNISQQNFGSSKKLPMFVVPNRLRSTGSQQFISNRLNKAGFLRQFYFGSLGRFGDFQGRSASFVIHINQIFGQTMPNRHKNLKKTAQGASCSTANTRNSVKSIRQSRTVTSSSALVAPNKKSLDFVKKDLEITKIFPIFALRNDVKDFRSIRQQHKSAIIAGFLREVYFDSLSSFRKNIKGTPFFCYIHNLIFGLKMRNDDKKLKKTAQGASASTANTRKRVTSITDKSSVDQSKNSLHPIFPLKITGNRVLPVTLITRVGNHLSVLHDGDNYIMPLNSHSSFFENIFQAMDELMMDGVELDWVAETGRGTLIIEDNKVYLWHDYAAHICFAHGRTSEEHFKKITQIKLY